MDDEVILKADAILHVDEHCYSCKKLCAVSNMVEWDGRKYCQDKLCWPTGLLRACMHFPG